MDFELHYTEEQEEFAREVRAWIDANIPQIDPPEDLLNMTHDMFKQAREFRHKLGEKGWLAPTYPSEYGGGGLDVAHAVVIAQELAREHLIFRMLADRGVDLFAPAILVWGTEEQKKRFIPPIIKGEIITWQGFTEPEAGSDLASLKARAVRDGNEYIINGEKTFIGASYDVDYVFTLAVTDPTRPRHHNMGAFMVPAHIPGVKIIPLDLFAEAGWPGKHHIYYEDVRIPADHLIGHETSGWQVTQSSLELEHGGMGAIGQRDNLFERTVEFCKETTRGGKPLSQDPDVRRVLVDTYIKNEIGRLFSLRNYWMRHAKQHGAGYEGSQLLVHSKSNAPKEGTALLEVLGPRVLLTDPRWAPLRGAMELQQRDSICTHPGGTTEIQKVIVARRMGISRTVEKAAKVV